MRTLNIFELQQTTGGINKSKSNNTKLTPYEKLEKKEAEEAEMKKQALIWCPKAVCGFMVGTFIAAAPVMLQFLTSSIFGTIEVI